MQINHNSNPSAPPEDDEYEWIANSMNNPNESENNNQPQGFIQPNDMPIPDAIQQQIIYQRIMGEKAKKEQKNNDEKQEHKQEPGNNNNNNNNKPKDSFMNKDVLYPESSLYKTAGIAIWRPKPNGKGIQFMMGLETKTNSLSFFNGKKNENDKTPIDTAIRQFHQQTGNKLDNNTLQQVSKMLMCDNERCLFWKSEWESVLYYYQMSYDYNIVKDYNIIKKWNSEIKSIHWIDFHKIYKSIFITGNPIKLSKNNKFSLQSFVVGMLLHKENKKYLTDLYIKYGGDINNLQPINNGIERNTIQSFKQIPKVIRLNILSPITYNLLYIKWIECDINSIEDYQILISLITSICPETGRNFLLYYTNNKLFKHSKTQYIIDTIPSFNNLKTKLINKLKQFVTQINIIPTFIVSDNFKGISLAFKKKEVLWKDINSNNNDDEKGLGNMIYNKASDWAQAWFGGDNNDPDGEEEFDGSWKWQFMNDKNKFEDFKNENSKLLELSFLNGNSFTNFKRKKVNYQANFKTMCQKNLNTSNIRAIRRVPSNVKGDKSSDNNNNSININYNAPILQYYKWQFKENGTWMDYDIDISKQLNTFKINCNSNNNYFYSNKYDMRHTFSCNIKNKNNNINYNYLIDIKNNIQKNMSTKKERVIQQIPVYNNNNNFNNNNFGIYGYKWQFKDDGHNKWTDYEVSISNYIENKYTNNYFNNGIFTVNTNNKSYKIHFNTMQQQCLATGKFRSIRRQSINNNFNFNNNININNGPIKHKWEWQDDDNSYKKYNNFTSNQIENAFNSGIKKYFFVSNKNNNSYEINFVTMSQYNVQTGKQRKVRKKLIEPKWKGVGPNPKKWKGPIINNNNRRTFDKKIIELYCVVGDMVANEVVKSGKLIRGSLGPFGSGLYFYDNKLMTKQMAKDRSVSNKGNIIVVKVFVGKEFDVSNMDDKQYDFITLQKNGYDSVSRALGFGKEYIVYNWDQICVVKVDKYN